MISSYTGDALEGLGVAAWLVILMYQQLVQIDFFDLH